MHTLKVNVTMFQQKPSDDLLTCCLFTLHILNLKLFSAVFKPLFVAKFLIKAISSKSFLKGIETWIIQLLLWPPF